jgi:hypothetical protein
MKDLFALEYPLAQRLFIPLSYRIFIFRVISYYFAVFFISIEITQNNMKFQENMA